jgi:ribosome-associated protein
MIPITSEISLDEGELTETFARASGPGGQNVNKVATAVQLRFDARHSPSLPPAVRERLEELAGNLATDEGVIVITARRSRSQAENRADALERLVDLIRRAARPATPRRPTKPTRANKLERLETKRRRALTKRLRSARIGADHGE